MSDQQKSGERAPNRLIKEHSPYLRQHAYNPVDWYPWGAEAFARARQENKPILLSVGYSACHWCHVMERESFENESIAGLMNDNFISIKVDREERPDVDQIYMDAVQMITGRGGWPLTVFLTPEGKPFYGGTYFPPADQQGTPGFPRVLAAIAEAYRRNGDEVRQNGDKLAAALAAIGQYSASDAEVEPDLAIAAAHALARTYDGINGGLGRAPKFPSTFVFSLFMRAWASSRDEAFAEMIRHTLRKMARGGIYDQIGGGFHRYSVDERWLVPHFEKMLYDNALLARLYLDAARALDENEFLSVARETLDYVLREMTSAEGGFYAAQDADSEDGEGEFFLWTPAQIEAAVGERLAPIASRYFDVSEDGNFEGRNVLHRTLDVADAARMFHLTPAEMDEAIATIRSKLFAAREKRVRPARDDKILAAWNGMMISALADGWRVLRDPRYRDSAERAARFVMTRLWDGRVLRRSFKDGAGHLNGYLEDYALVANAMIDLYQATLDPSYLDHARAMADAILAGFLDREHGGFFLTSDDHEKLLTRPKPVFDGSTPSGTSATVFAMLRLRAYGGDERYYREAERAIKLFRELMKEQPFAFSNLLEAVDLYLRGPLELVLVGKRDSAEFRQWTERIGLLYLPNLTIYAVEPDAPRPVPVPEAARDKKQIDGRLTAYLCRERTCLAPVTSLAELEAQLRGLSRSRLR